VKCGGHRKWDREERDTNQQPAQAPPDSHSAAPATFDGRTRVRPPAPNQSQRKLPEAKVRLRRTRAEGLHPPMPFPQPPLDGQKQRE
jgi:hypothetical protein